MSKENKINDTQDQMLTKEYEAYKTLQNWVKTVPGTIRQLEDKGDMDQLIKYKKQVKLVLHKLEEIKLELENGK